MFVQKQPHLGGADQDDLGDDRNPDGSHMLHEFMKGIEIKHGRREEIIGAEPGQRLHFLKLHIRHLPPPPGIDAGADAKIGLIGQFFSGNILPFPDVFDNGKKFPRIDVKIHDLLQAVAGNAVVFGKGEDVLYARFRRLEQIVLQFHPVPVATGGLEDGIELLLPQDPARPHRIDDEPVDF